MGFNLYIASFPQRSSSCIQQLDRPQLPTTIIQLHSTTRPTQLPATIIQLHSKTRPTSATRIKHLAVSPRLDLRQLPASNIQLRTSTTRPYPAIDIIHLAEDHIQPPRTLHTRFCSQMEFIPDLNFLKVESVRLDTFHCWSLLCPVRPEELARQGFYFTGKDDMVKCYFCQGQLNQWTAEDVVSTEHSKWFPDCPFVQGKSCGNVPMVQTNLKHRSYLMFYDRMESFQGWHKAKSLSPNRMASAGFFKITPFDHVMCFSCGVRLNEWVPNNDPWEEHKKFSPDCQFLKERYGYYYDYDVMTGLAAFQSINITQNKRTMRDPRQETEYHSSQQETGYRPSQQETGYHPSQQETEHHSSQQKIRYCSSQQETGYHPSQQETGYHSSQQETSTHEAAKDDDDPLLNLAMFSPLSEPVQPKAGPSRATFENLDELALSEPVLPNAQLQAKAGSSRDSIEILDELGTEQLKQIILDQEDERLCKICFERKLKVIFQPCNHMVCCTECGEHQRNCPICRRKIDKISQIYFS